MTSPDPVVALSRRVSQLERRGRLLSLALAGLLGLGAVAATVAPRVAEPLQASRFEVVDAEGKVRGSYGMDANGELRFTMLGVKGKERLAAYVKGEETFLVLKDPKGLSRLGLTVDSGPHPHIVLMDGNQKPRIHAALGDTGHPTLLFVHEDGTMPAGMGIHTSGEPWWKLGDEMVSELPAAAAARPAEGGGGQGK